VTIDYSRAIKRILERLDEKGERLSEFSALDFFARTGEWQTRHYASLVKKIHAWEIDSKFEEKLREVLPSHAHVVIGDSFRLARQTNEKFDLIVLDNPMGCYDKYCEHFEALDVVLGLLASEGIVVFNVKTRPFNYEDKHEWRARRDNFYGKESSNLSEDFVISFYRDYLAARGWETQYSFLELRPQETGLYAMTSKLRRLT